MYCMSHTVSWVLCEWILLWQHKIKDIRLIFQMQLVYSVKFTNTCFSGCEIRFGKKLEKVWLYVLVYNTGLVVMHHMGQASLRVHTSKSSASAVYFLVELLGSNFQTSAVSMGKSHSLDSLTSCLLCMLQQQLSSLWPIVVFCDLQGPKYWKILLLICVAPNWGMICYVKLPSAHPVVVQRASLSMVPISCAVLILKLKSIMFYCPIQLDLKEIGEKHLPEGIGKNSKLESVSSHRLVNLRNQKAFNHLICVP